MQGGSGHAESESMQGGSCKRPERYQVTINDAPGTITGTTGKAAPKGLRTGIADHLASNFFRSLDGV